MATWASYTEDQRTAVQSVVNAVRSIQVAMQKLAEDGQVISAAWNGGISTLVNGLDAGEMVPNGTAYAGAQSLGKADILNLVQYIIDLSNPANAQAGGGYNTPLQQALRVKACGVNAAIGQ